MAANSANELGIFGLLIVSMEAIVCAALRLFEIQTGLGLP